MKICNIVIPDGYGDSTTRKLIDNPLVNVCEISRMPGHDYDSWKAVPALWYGYRVAGQGFDFHNINILSEGYIQGTKDQYWCFNESERPSTYAEEFVYDCLTRVLLHIDDGIDPVFDGFDIETFVAGLGDFPLIHNGRYELYFGEYTPDGDILISSMKKDSLKYINIDPDDLFYNIIDDLEGHCMVVSTDEFDLFETDYQPTFIVDWIQSKSGNPLTPETIVSMFKPRHITKGELLTYYMKLAREYKIVPFSNNH